MHLLYKTQKIQITIQNTEDPNYYTKHRRSKCESHAIISQSDIIPSTTQSAIRKKDVKEDKCKATYAVYVCVHCGMRIGTSQTKEMLSLTSEIC